MRGKQRATYGEKKGNVIERWWRKKGESHKRQGEERKN